MNQKGIVLLGQPRKVSKKEKNQVYSVCLAGSIARGKTDHEDLNWHIRFCMIKRI